MKPCLMRLMLFLLPVFGIWFVPPVGAIGGSQIDYARFTGEELVKRLGNQDEVPQAYYELWRRSRNASTTEQDEGFESFCDTRLNPTVVVCQQGNTRPPLYLVLYDSPALSRPAGPGDRRPVIDAYDSSGKRINPFEGNNVLEGVISDLNGDGLTERAEVTNYGIEGINHLQVLEISAVKEKAVPLLAVVINWNALEWGFRVADSDKDGISAIEAGPSDDNGFHAKATWTWDPGTKSYIGPAGQSGDHFRVIDGKKLWSELVRLKAEKLDFPTEPKGSPSGVSKVSRISTRASYKYQTLKDAPDELILRFMSDAKNEFDREFADLVPKRIPESFWGLPAKEAAIALLSANREKDSRTRYKISDQERNQPAPDRGMVCFSDESARCYNAVDSHFFLRVDPEESYLAYTRTWSGGMVFYNAVHDQPAFDFRLCQVPYRDALHVLHVIWWLKRAELSNPRALASIGFSTSTADGHADLICRADGYPEIHVAGTRWMEHLSERWSGEIDDEAILNFGAYLIAEVLAERLGEDWKKYEPKHRQNILARQSSSPQYEAREMDRLAKIAALFLSWYSPREDRINTSSVVDAVTFCGNFGMDDQADRVRQIAKVLMENGADKIPPPKTEILDQEAIKGIVDMEKLQAEMKSQLRAFHLSHREQVPGRLLKRTELASRQISEANDPDALYRWAISSDAGNQWAFQRLAKINPTRYVEALEWWMRNSEAEVSRQFFEQIQQTDASRAIGIARGISPEGSSPLVVSAFLLLQEKGLLKDEDEWIKALTGVVRGPQNGWNERGRAIEALVPVSEPLRFKQTLIDEVLVKMFDPKLADEGVNFTLAEACQALARRGRLECFEEMVKLFEGREETDPRKRFFGDASVRQRILGALSRMAQQDPARLAASLSKVIRPHLTHTNLMMTDILWAVWASDLRDLLPDLERISTDDPEEYEDKKASSYGGNPSPVEGGFHLARKIVALWSEQDQLTRAKLLIGLVAGDPYYFISDAEEGRRNRLELEAKALSSKLTLEEKRKLLEFLSRYEESWNDDHSEGAVEKRKVTELMKKLLELPEPTLSR